MIFQQENTKEVAAAAAEAEAKSNMTTTELILDQLESWYETLITNLPSMAVALIVLIVTYFISKWVSRGVQKLVQHKVNQVSVRKLIGKVAAAVVIVGGLFIALNVLDLNETVQAIIAGAGVSGLVIGLALQGTLSNTLSGVHLSFRKMVSVGDWVETNGYEGEIISIDLNKFIMREADNNTVIIPNKLIMDNPMKNYGLTKPCVLLYIVVLDMRVI